MLRAFVLSGAVLLCSGCSSVIHKTFSVDSSPPTSVALDVKQRAILATERVDRETGATRRVVCAEPSPDALVGVAAAASLGADVPQKVRAEAAGTLAEAVRSIGKRTQTVQLLRDGLYRACEAYLNGAISKEEYAVIISRVDDFAVTVLAIDGLLGGDQVGESVVQTTAKGQAALLEARADQPQDPAAAAAGGGAPGTGRSVEVVATAPAARADAGETSRVANAAIVKDIIRWYYDMQLEFARAEMPMRMKKAGMQASAEPHAPGGQ